jgi:tetratricopeptide (TPR) repeat protein
MSACVTRLRAGGLHDLRPAARTWERRPVSTRASCAGPRPADRAAACATALSISLALLTPVVALALPGDAPEISAIIAGGDAAAARLDLEGAIAAYRSASTLSSASYDAAWKLARALADKATLSHDPAEQKRLCEEAEKFGDAAIRLNPSDARGHTALAVAVGKLALFEGGRRKVELSKEVKAEAEKALQCDPDDHVALHVLGIWNREMVELNWFLKSLAQVLYGKFPPASLAAAIADLRRAVEIEPAAIPHHVELGITLASAKRWAEAKVEFDQALALPSVWATDDYYRALARQKSAYVAAHLN